MAENNYHSEIPEDLQKQVVELVRSIPRGKVMSYGQIGITLGIKDARVIGWAMHNTGGTDGVPWWRVLNNDGKITIKDADARTKQKELLVAEGIAVNDDFVLDIEKYRFGTMPRQKKLF